MIDFVIGFIAPAQNSFWIGIAFVAIFVALPWAIGMPIAALVVRMMRRYWHMRDDSAAIIAIAWPITLVVLTLVGLWELAWYCFLLPLLRLITRITGGTLEL